MPDKSAPAIEMVLVDRKVRQIQNRIYWLAGGWLIVNVISFGILFWADEVNRATN